MDKIELDWLKRWAHYSPRRVALRCADSRQNFTYQELFERSSVLAKELEQHGVVVGDRVAVLAQNEPETIFLYFALQRLGAILVPVNFRFTAREVAHVLQDSGAKLLFCQECFRENVEGGEITVLPFSTLKELLFTKTFSGSFEVRGSIDAPVMILYTSGTTGAPKGALITNKMLFWNSVNTGLRLEITPKDSTIIFHPLFHTSGWNVLTTPFFHHGASIVMLKKFDPERVLALCAEEKISILFGVPTMMDMMARAENFSLPLPSVRYAIVGGEPMPVDLIRIWAEKNIPVRQGYGLTEFGPNVFSLNEEDALRKIGSIGFPNFYVDVKIVGNEGQELCEPGEVGELFLRGPTATPGYWGKPPHKEEWLATGDLVKRDEEGYFYVVGRKKDMYISGAENVYPAEVEQYLRSFQKIREVAVVGVKDSKWGEVGRCFYATENGQHLSEEELKSFCLQGLAKYKVPKSFVHLPELPKGHSGKILKRALLEAAHP